MGQKRFNAAWRNSRQGIGFYKFLAKLSNDRASFGLTGTVGSIPVERNAHGAPKVGCEASRRSRNIQNATEKR